MFANVNQSLFFENKLLAYLSSDLFYAQLKSFNSLGVVAFWIVASCLLMQIKVELYENI